jgi:hypothetical protein
MARGRRGAGRAGKAGAGIFAKKAKHLFKKAPKRDKRGRFARDPKRPRSTAPEWTDADRRREWRRLADDPNSPLTPDQRREIRERGRGPTRTNPFTGETETMELSHEPIPRREGGTDVVPRWPDDHAAIDPDRKLKGGRRPNQPPDE